MWHSHGYNFTHLLYVDKHACVVVAFFTTAHYFSETPLNLQCHESRNTFHNSLSLSVRTTAFCLSPSLPPRFLCFRTREGSFLRPAVPDFFTTFCKLPSSLLSSASSSSSSSAVAFYSSNSACFRKLRGEGAQKAAVEEEVDKEEAMEK